MWLAPVNVPLMDFIFAFILRRKEDDLRWRLSNYRQFWMMVFPLFFDHVFFLGALKFMRVWYFESWYTFYVYMLPLKLPEVMISYLNIIILCMKIYYVEERVIYRPQDSGSLPYLRVNRVDFWVIVNDFLLRSVWINLLIFEVRTTIDEIWEEKWANRLKMKEPEIWLVCCTLDFIWDGN